MIISIHAKQNKRVVYAHISLGQNVYLSATLNTVFMLDYSLFAK